MKHRKDKIAKTNALRQLDKQKIHTLFILMNGVKIKAEGLELLKNFLNLQRESLRQLC